MSGEDQGVSLGRFLQLVLIGVGLFGVWHLLIAESIVIASASMEPTLKVGTYALLDKVTFLFRSPRRGEIVVFTSPVGTEEFTKRIIAVPGDTIELRNKKVVLNGAEQSEPYARFSRPEERLVGDNLPEWKVPRNCYFVLGDNRDESNDSSVWKDASKSPAPCLPAKNVRGLVRGFF
ncbi:MAG: signal peptidase I [Elusimicrobia bacterium]|nr:signal peptidase I [Elusimicrobiota bacterium]